MDFHYEKDLTQEFVASLFRMNRSYLSSAFKARTGISFVDYVNQVRISHAKEMLKKTDKKTYQIAQAVGYENAKYFFQENGRNYTGAVPKPVTCLLWQICGFGEDMGKVMKIGQNT